jgi:hypothetical protein
MQQNHLDGLVFSQAELLALMDAVRPPELLGIDTEALIPNEPERHRALILEGTEQLKARNLLSVENDVHILHSELLVIARVIAFPQLITLLLKDIPAVGQQKFVYYQADLLIVEHTMPEPGAYRFAVVPNTLAQLDRMVFVLPVGQAVEEPDYDFVLDQEVFFQARELVLSGEMERAASKLAAQGVDSGTARALLQAMESPRFSGTVAYLRVETPDVLDAVNLAVLQGERSAWVMGQIEPGVTDLRLRTVEAGEFKEVLFEALLSLVQASTAAEAR